MDFLAKGAKSHLRMLRGSMRMLLAPRMPAHNLCDKLSLNYNHSCSSAPPSNQQKGMLCGRSLLAPCVSHGSLVLERRHQTAQVGQRAPGAHLGQNLMTNVQLLFKHGVPL